MSEFDNNNNVVIEHARLIFRNFSGAERTYNPAGRRNFSVVLSEDLAVAMKNNGWNVKYLQPKDPEDPPQAHLPVAVNFNNYPPKIVMLTSDGKTILDESNVSQLDVAEIENVDLVIRPYTWDRNGARGVKAYLKTMYVTIWEDELEKKYAHPDPSDMFHG